jgi:hypothetical protein
MLALSLFLQNAFKVTLLTHTYITVLTRVVYQLGYEENIEDLVTSLLKKAVSRVGFHLFLVGINTTLSREPFLASEQWLPIVSVLDTLLTGIIITMPESVTNQQHLRLFSY